MADERDLAADVDALAEQVAALDAKLERTIGTADAVDGRLRADLDEVIHDLTALVTEAGHLLGEPFASRARDIVTKRQTSQEG